MLAAALARIPRTDWRAAIEHVPTRVAIITPTDSIRTGPWQDYGGYWAPPEAPWGWVIMATGHRRKRSGVE